MTTATHATPTYLAHLNTEQAEAVHTLQGPLLVLAGAGTGKTRVLTARIAHIISSGAAYPSQILAVTFTNKAAREMTERVEKLVPKSAEGLWLGTFHAIAARILRRHAELLGLPSNFTIIDTDDQLRLLKSLILAAGLDEKKYTPKLMLGLIQRWKDQGYVPAKVPAADGYDPLQAKALALYKEYQQRLTSLGSVDFGDLLLHNITLFTEHADILADYQRRFRYILVDEYQDTNIAQYLWLRLLAQAHKNICCVGDDDQSIYGWRGAEVGNILKFEHDFPGAKVIRLEQNYRSTTHILSSASHLIRNNEQRLGKELWTESDGGQKVKIVSVWDDREEARYIAEEIEILQRQESFSLNQIAILVRAGFQTRAFEECFISCAIPYRVIGGLRFYERQEIRDVIAYMRVIALPSDDLALERIINTPKRSIGEATLQLLHVQARSTGCSLMQAIKQLLPTGELKRAKVPLEKLVASFEHWRALLEHKHYVEVVNIMLKESGYLAMWQQEHTQESEGRLENIKELLTALEEFGTLTEFLEHISLVTDNEGQESTNMVNIMTLHAAKGLEFEAVFLPGWEEGLFPHQRSLDEKGNAGLEEERRLAYVGLTRARQYATITHAMQRRVYNQFQNSIASRFIEELPLEHCYKRTLTTNSGYSTGALAAIASKYNTGSLASSATVKSTPKEESAELSRGDKVFHEKFGYGYVQHVDGNHVEVSFSKSGPKKLVSSFLKKC